MWFFFNSPRFLLVQGLGATCDSAARIIGGCIDRIMNLDESNISNGSNSNSDGKNNIYKKAEPTAALAASVETYALLPTFAVELRGMEAMLSAMASSEFSNSSALMFVCACACLLWLICCVILSLCKF